MNNLNIKNQYVKLQGWKLHSILYFEISFSPLSSDLGNDTSNFDVGIGFTIQYLTSQISTILVCDRKETILVSNVYFMTDIFSKYRILQNATIFW